MCGICGVVDFSGSQDAAGLVRRMTPALRHRGPDDEGYLEAGPLALGMRRLSIIDLEGGHQPIYNEDETIAVVLNGEIYNFQTLTKELEQLGHRFRTRSDAEVIVHAYEEWGADCVQRLEGMFAVAVQAKQRAKSKELLETSTLFLARDRLGIKPLYYWMSNVQSPKSKVDTAGGDADVGPWTLDIGHRLFLFASEVRALLASGVVPRELARTALESYLLFGSVSEPMTLVDGVLSLPPGHRVTIDLNAEALVIRPEAYWEVARGREQRAKGKEQRAEEIATETQRHGEAEREGLRAKSEERRPMGEELRARSEEQSAKSDPERRPFALSSLPFAARSSLPFAATRVRELLEESVRLHLIADVPVGVFLSGGIDSTSLAALASRANKGVHTFTVAFKEQEFSEAAIARRTAEKLGTNHDELLLSSDEMLARLPEAIGALDQPSMDGINTWFVSWAARQAGLKVALSGLGGDELFGGYANTFRWTPRYQRLADVSAHVPSALRSAMSFALAGAGQGLSRQDAAKKIAALWNDSKSLPDPYYFARAVFAPPQVRELMKSEPGADRDSQAGNPLGVVDATGLPRSAQDLVPTSGSNGSTAKNDSDRHRTPWWNWLSTSANQTVTLDAFAAVSCLEIRSYLVNTLLRDTDSMSMAHSLEVRVPFLHHPLVEFVTGLPAALKVRDGSPKALLVAALRDLLPEEVIAQKKRGFIFPWQQWLRGPLKEKVAAGLSSLAPALRDVLDEKKVRGVWEAYLNGKTSWSRPWSLYVLNEWCQCHLQEGQRAKS